MPCSFGFLVNDIVNAERGGYNMERVKFVGKFNTIDQWRVYKYYLKVDKDKIKTWDQETRHQRLGFIKDHVIRGHKWKKGEIAVGDLMRVYMNPGATWLKRFSCTCEKAQYPCPECSNKNHTFTDFIKNQENVWRKMDENGINVCEEPKSDQAHRSEMETMFEKMDRL